MPPSTMRPLGIGLVGCGFVTRDFHLPALRGLAGLEVVAVADVDETPLRAVHHVDLWRWLLGDEVAELFAVSGAHRRHEDASSVAGRMRSGTITSLTVLDASAPQHVLEIYGDAGALTLDLYRSDGLEVLGLGEFSGAPARRLRRAGRLARRLLTRGLGGDFAASYRAQWSHFADAIRRNTEPACGLAEGRRALEVALAASWSAAQGKPVSLAREQASAVPLTDGPA